jgi:hypothetical protein
MNPANKPSKRGHSRFHAPLHLINLVPFSKKQPPANSATAKPPWVVGGNAKIERPLIDLTKIRE